MRCRATRAGGASRWRSTQSPLASTRGATRSASVADLTAGGASAAAGTGSALGLTRARGQLALALMVASGCAALGLQIVWTQQSTLWLGHEAAAVLAVVAAFFGGVALGSLLLGARIERLARPARAYALCEIVIGAWSLALAASLAPVSTWLPALVGEQPSALWQATVTFGGT